MVDYFPKHVEAISIHQQSAAKAGDLLFGLMCHNGCSDLHITDQAREFVNTVQGELYKMTNYTPYHFCASCPGKWFSRLDEMYNANGDP